MNKTKNFKQQLPDVLEGGGTPEPKNEQPFYPLWEDDRSRSSMSSNYSVSTIPYLNQFHDDNAMKRTLTHPSMALPGRHGQYTPPSSLSLNYQGQCFKQLNRLSLAYLRDSSPPLSPAHTKSGSSETGFARSEDDGEPRTQTDSGLGLGLSFQDEWRFEQERSQEPHYMSSGLEADLAQRLSALDFTSEPDVSREKPYYNLDENTFSQSSLLESSLDGLSQLRNNRYKLMRKILPKRLHLKSWNSSPSLSRIPDTTVLSPQSPSSSDFGMHSLHGSFIHTPEAEAPPDHLISGQLSPQYTTAPLISSLDSVELDPLQRHCTPPLPFLKQEDAYLPTQISSQIASPVSPLTLPSIRQSAGHLSYASSLAPMQSPLPSPPLASAPAFDASTPQKFPSRQNSINFPTPAIDEYPIDSHNLEQHKIDQCLSQMWIEDKAFQATEERLIESGWSSQAEIDQLRLKREEVKKAWQLKIEAARKRFEDLESKSDTISSQPSIELQ